MAKNLREKLNSENITINEFVDELDFNIKAIEASRFFPESRMKNIKNFRDEIVRDDKLTDKDVDKNISKLMGFREGVSFVDRTISVIKTTKGKVLAENDVIAQAGMAKTFSELASKGFHKDAMQATANRILESAGLDGSENILETIPTDEKRTPKIKQIIDYGKKHPGTRSEGKGTLIKLLEEAGEKQDSSILARVTYKQLDNGRGLSESEKSSFKGSRKNNEPDSPPPGTVLKNWVKGYEKELHESTKLART